MCQRQSCMTSMQTWRAQQVLAALCVLLSSHVGHVPCTLQPLPADVLWCAVCSGVAAAPATLVSQLQPGTVAAQSLQLPVQPIQQPPVRTCAELLFPGRMVHATDYSHCLQYILDGFELSFRETKPVITLDNATCVAYQILRKAPLSLAPASRHMPAWLCPSRVCRNSHAWLCALQRS